MRAFGFAILAGLVSTSTVAFAQGPNNGEFDIFCHGNIADGGYSVEIRPGWSAETARVSVGVSRIGVHFVETYDVSVTPSESGTLFQGRYLTLTLSEGRPRSDDRIHYRATFAVEYRGHTIRGRLECNSPRPQAPPAQAR